MSIDQPSIKVQRSWSNIFYSLVREYQIGTETDSNYTPQFSNDVFEVNPYQHDECDCECECQENCITTRPNFLYKPTGFKIWWYKHPMRSAYMSTKISTAEFTQIILNCISSLGDNIVPKIGDRVLDPMGFDCHVIDVIAKMSNSLFLVKTDAHKQQVQVILTDDELLVD